MNLNESEVLENWLSDASFIHWAKNTHPKDVEKWETYLNQHPEQRGLAEKGRFSLYYLHPKPIEVNEERSQRALTRLKKQLKETEVSPQLTVKSIYSHQKWFAAASILFLLGLGLWFFSIPSSNSEILWTTGFGETKNITLKDGSKVILNANSTLKYNEQESRKASLTGEAFFEIAKKPKTGEIFQVFTSDLSIKVLGTVFNVNSRNEQTSVFLEEGKVALKLEESEQEMVEMKVGELVTYSKKQQKILQHKKSEVAKNTSWKEGIIWFKDTSLKDALIEISDIYGIDFKIEIPASNEQLFSGGVPIKNLNITLEILQEVYGLEITKTNNQYIVRK